MTIIDVLYDADSTDYNIFSARSNYGFKHGKGRKEMTFNYVVIVIISSYFMIFVKGWLSPKRMP